LAEEDPGAVLVGAWLRAAVFGGHRLVLAAPAPTLTGPTSAAAVSAALCGGAAALVLERMDVVGVAAAAADLRSVAGAAAAARAGLGSGSLRGDAAERGRRVLDVASDVLDRLAGDGWASLLSPETEDVQGDRLGRGAIIELAGGERAAAPLLEELI
jgi:hypothetical protein